MFERFKAIWRAPARVAVMESAVRDAKWRLGELETRNKAQEDDLSDAKMRTAELEQRMAVLEDALTPAVPGVDEEKMEKEWDRFWTYNGTAQEGEK